MYFLYCLLALSFAFSAENTPATVKIRLPFEPPTLDWNLGDVPIHVINNVTEGLYKVDENGALKPVEAERLPRLANAAKGLWRIRLRAGLKWSDGHALTAGDYVASWNRLRDPATGSTYAHLLHDFASARSVDARELEIELRNHKARQFPVSALTHWATFPVRTDLIQRFTTDWGSKPEHMAFNGPYKIETYEHEAKFVLVPNTQHRPPGRLARIEALIVQDDATALSLYERGGLHFVADLATLDRAALARRPDFHSMRSPVLAYLGVDAKDPLLGSPTSRRALSLALDRALFPKLVGPGITPISQLTPDLRHLVPLERLAAKAAGLELAGKSTTLAYYEKGINRTIIEFVQAQWRSNLDFTTHVQASEIKTYWKKLAVEPWPVFLNSYSPPVPDVRYYFELLRSDNPMNLTRWSSAAYDAAVDRGDYAAAAKILEAETPIIPLYFRAYEYLESPHLKGARLNPMTSLDLSDAQLAP